LEDEITVLEPRTVLDGHRLIALDPSNLTLTSPTSGICGQPHISATDGALHLTLKQAHILKEPNGHSLVSEQKREKKPVRPTVFRQQLTSVRKPWHVLHLLQPLFVLLNYF
jgi:hypothetical protein